MAAASQTAPCPNTRARKDLRRQAAAMLAAEEEGRRLPTPDHTAATPDYALGRGAAAAAAAAAPGSAPALLERRSPALERRSPAPLEPFPPPLVKTSQARRRWGGAARVRGITSAGAHAPPGKKKCQPLPTQTKGHAEPPSLTTLPEAPEAVSGTRACVVCAGGCGVVGGWSVLGATQPGPPSPQPASAPAPHLCRRRPMPPSWRTQERSAAP